MTFYDEIQELARTTRQISEYRLRSSSFSPFREEIRNFQGLTFDALNSDTVGDGLNESFAALSDTGSDYNIGDILQAEIVAVRTGHQKIIDDMEERRERRRVHPPTGPGYQADDAETWESSTKTPNPFKRALGMAKTVFESLLDMLNLPKALKDLLTATCEAIALVL